jgi:hypothetical protein
MIFIWLLNMAVSQAAPDVGAALLESQRFKVIVDDMLGEGKGHDPQPLYPEQEVNCLIWLQWVLARSYSKEHSSVEQNLNALRYYEGTIDFGHRKHFVDRWTMLEPGPLVSSSLCVTDRAETVLLNLNGLTEKVGFTDPLYEPEQARFLISYSSRAVFEGCVGALPDGYYVLFPIATMRYLERWSSPSPMLQVHAMVLEINGEERKLWHASIDKKGVVWEEPLAFSERMGEMIQGFRLYELSPSWPE